MHILCPGAETLRAKRILHVRDTCLKKLNQGKHQREPMPCQYQLPPYNGCIAELRNYLQGDS